MRVSSDMCVRPRVRACARAIAIAASVWICGAVNGFAQPAPVFSLDPLNVGDCRVVVKIVSPRGGDQVGVIVDQTLMREQTVVAGGDPLTFSLSEPLRAGAVVRVRVNGSESVNAGPVAGLRVTVADKPGARVSGACEEESEVDESPFSASVFFGGVVDTFAPDKVGNYQNPSAGNRKTQEIFGVDFDYRALGRSDSRLQFWINGETSHGMRTADIDCNPPDPKDIPPVCGKDLKPTDFPDRARYILEHATSLEAYVSPRLEFHTLQGGTDSSANLYVTSRIGFLSLEDAPNVFASIHFALGLLANEGNYAGSYIEAGWGKNELFTKRWNRLKVDGLLSFSLERIPGIGNLGRFFVQMVIDNDLKDEGPDSIRTYFGFDVDLKSAIGGL
jgi:hypothetical protein